jgi:hypothetical protein
MGAHYAMDVMGGRTLALYDMAHLLANDPEYMGVSVRGAQPIKGFQSAVKTTRAELLASCRANAATRLKLALKKTRSDSTILPPMKLSTM